MVLGLLLVSQETIAAEIPEIRGTAGLPDIQIFERIEETLLPFGKKEDLISSSVQIGQGQRGSHVRLKYSAKHPVPVVFVFARAQQYKYETDPDLVMAVLPPGEDTEVLLSLMESPSWSLRRDSGIILNVYGYADAMISIEEVAYVNRTTLLSRIGLGFHHLFIPEQMRIASMNIMRGYRIFGMPFNLILGMIMIIGTGAILFISKKNRLIRTATLVIAMIILYQARAGADFIRATIVDASEWRTTGMNKEYADLHLAVAGIREIEQRSQSRMRIATCGGYERPLEYFLSPLSVDSDAASWNLATHAVLPPVWSIDGTIIHCDSQSRAGTILQTFPKGSAIVEFRSP